MKVYYMNVSQIDTNDKKWYKYLSENRLKKLNKLKKNDKKSQSIAAELLLNYSVNGDFRIKTDYEYDENCKLHLKNGMFANLSHSGEYAVCVVGDCEVGIDVQKHRNVDLNLSKRFFTSVEAEYIANADNVENAFFKVWTRKESFVKAVGKGLAIPLKSFSVLDAHVDYDGRRYRFKNFALPNDNYSLSVCFLSDTLL